jgi:undecaprenyl diphosphate synthase
VQRGELQLDAIDTTSFGGFLSTHDLPDPDLIVRTSGEMRVSNFLLWQMAYAEMVFSDVLWPDFAEQDFAAAIASYGKRERRFGAVVG